MVKTKEINLNKATYDLTKSGDNMDLSKPNMNVDLTKSTNNINLVKNSEWLEVAKKDIVSNLQNLAKKPKSPGGWPDIEITDATDTLTKIPIQPFELYWTSKTADPDYSDGWPFSEFPIALIPEIVLDSCHVGFGVQPVLAFIKLPQQQIVLKYAECDPNKPPPLPKPSPTPNSVFLSEPPPGCYYVTWWTVTKYVDYCFGNIEPEFENISYEYGNGDYSLPIPLSEVTESVTIDTPFDDEYANYYKNYYYKGEAREQAIKGMRPLYQRPNLINTYILMKAGQNPDDWPQKGFDYFGSLSDAILQGNYTETGTVVYYETYTPDGEREEYGSSKGHKKTTEIVRARTYGGEITPVIPMQNSEQNSNYFTNYKFGYATSYLICDGVPYDYPKNNPPPPVPLPPPPKYPKKKKKMDCCPQVLSLLKYLTLRVSEIDERVKELDKEVKKTNQCLGTEEYPASLPSTIINQDEGFLANFVAGLNDQVQVKNLTQLVVWFFERFDEVMGQWEIPIQIKDTDPTTPGDQPVGIKLPNLAEAQAEQFTMAFQSTVNIDLLINIATRILAEVGQIKQQGFKGYGLTQTLVDYFNYEYSEDAVDMPLSFAPDKDKFDELLKETTLKVAYPEFTDKENFKVTETRLLEMAAIIKALNWRKVDAGSDIKEQIKKSVLARAKQLDDEVKRQQDDLDKFVADAEKGYPNVPGMVNPGEPYGEPYASRPIVKRVEE